MLIAAPFPLHSHPTAALISIFTALASARLGAEFLRHSGEEVTMPEPGKFPIPTPVVVAVVVVIAVIVLVHQNSHQGTGSPASPGASTGPSGTPAAAAPAWTTFQDPYEQAFTVEVPKGWKVGGGTDRVGLLDYRFMVDLNSPDGQTNIRIGDAAVPPFAPLDGRHAEGTADDLGPVAQAVFASYRTGPEFAVLYARVRFYQTCLNPTADTTDVKFSIPDVAPSGQQSSAGRIAYSCNSGQKVAYADARTVQSPNLWTVITLASFIAPPAQVSLAQSILVHMTQTFNINSAWIPYQQQMGALGTQIMVAHTQQVMAQITAQVQQFEQKMQQEQAQFDSWDNIISGVTPTIDPLTGQAHDVWSGAGSEYWVDSQGNVVNSNSMPSGGGYTQLQVQTP